MRRKGIKLDRLHKGWCDEMGKQYVKESTYKNSDGEVLQKVETYFSKPKKVSYIIFDDKRR